jgi:hypothetical protein
VVGGIKCCWNRCSSNFSFQDEFIIVLPWGHQVDNNTFLKALLATLMMVVIKPKAYVLIIIKSEAMKSLLQLF